MVNPIQLIVMQIFLSEKNQVTPNNCYVIGTDGPATLNNPLDVLVHSSNLYIADSWK